MRFSLCCFSMFVGFFLFETGVFVYVCVRLCLFVGFLQSELLFNSFVFVSVCFRECLFVY